MALRYEPYNLTVAVSQYQVGTQSIISILYSFSFSLKCPVVTPLIPLVFFSFTVPTWCQKGPARTLLVLNLFKVMKCHQNMQQHGENAHKFNYNSSYLVKCNTKWFGCCQFSHPRAKKNKHLDSKDSFINIAPVQAIRTNVIFLVHCLMRYLGWDKQSSDKQFTL